MKVSKNRIAVTILASVVLVLFFATVAGLFYYRDSMRTYLKILTASCLTGSIMRSCHMQSRTIALSR